jgi:hypothetical protein
MPSLALTHVNWRNNSFAAILIRGIGLLVRAIYGHTLPQCELLGYFQHNKKQYLPFLAKRMEI